MCRACPAVVPVVATGRDTGERRTSSVISENREWQRGSSDGGGSRGSGGVSAVGHLRSLISQSETHLWRACDALEPQSQPQLIQSSGESALELTLCCRSLPLPAHFLVLTAHPPNKTSKSAFVAVASLTLNLSRRLFFLLAAPVVLSET